MEGFVRIGRKGDFLDGRPKNVSLEDGEVVVVNVAEMLHAFDNNCPHQHFSLLHQGAVEDCSITCPMHGWTFNLDSGRSTSGNGNLKKRAVRIVDGWVWVKSEAMGQNFSLFDGK